MLLESDSTLICWSLITKGLWWNPKSCICFVLFLVYMNASFILIFFRQLTGPRPWWIPLGGIRVALPCVGEHKGFTAIKHDPQDTFISNLSSLYDKPLIGKIITYFIKYLGQSLECVNKAHNDSKWWFLMWPVGEKKLCHGSWAISYHA